MRATTAQGELGHRPVAHHVVGGLAVDHHVGGSGPVVAVRGGVGVAEQLRVVRDGLLALVLPGEIQGLLVLFVYRVEVLEEQLARQEAAGEAAADDLGAVASVLREPTGATIPLSKLAPEQALKRLELAVVRRMEGYLHGDHRGLLPGSGSETNDARLYVPGQDDVRKMDWAVTARTQTPHVRDTIADRELEVWALLDATPSMNWGTEGVTKRDLGRAAIATIGFLSQKMGDRFGAFIMRPEALVRIPARSGRMEDQPRGELFAHLQQ